MNHRAAFAAVVIGLQVFFYSSFLKRADLTTSDFPTYYSVARLWQRGENPYSLENQCREMRPLTPKGECFPLAHPPILLPLLSSVSNENFTSSFWRWLAILACALVACFLILSLLTENAFGSAQSLVFYPTILSVFYANDTVFVLLGVTVWAYLLLYRDGDFMEREFLAGAALAFTAVKPQLTIILAVPLLFAKPKVFMWFCVSGLLLTLSGLKLVGVEGFKGIIEITRVMANGEGYGIGQQNMVNTTGWLVSAGLSPFWSWPLYIAAIAGLCVLWKRYGPSIATVSLSLMAALFFSPHTHNYDLALLAVPLIFAHRLAPLIASLIMIVAIVANVGYLGAIIIMLPMAAHYYKRLRNGVVDSAYFSQVGQAGSLSTH